MELEKIIRSEGKKILAVGAILVNLCLSGCVTFQTEQSFEDQYSVPVLESQDAGYDRIYEYGTGHEFGYH